MYWVARDKPVSPTKLGTLFLYVEEPVWMSSEGEYEISISDSKFMELDPEAFPQLNPGERIEVNITSINPLVKKG